MGATDIRWLKACQGSKGQRCLPTSSACCPSPLHLRRAKGRGSARPRRGKHIHHGVERRRGCPLRLAVCASQRLLGDCRHRGRPDRRIAPRVGVAAMQCLDCVAGAAGLAAVPLGLCRQQGSRASGSDHIAGTVSSQQGRPRGLQVIKDIARRQAARLGRDAGQEDVLQSRGGGSSGAVAGLIGARARSETQAGSRQTGR